MREGAGSRLGTHGGTGTLDWAEDDYQPPSFSDVALRFLLGGCWQAGDIAVVYSVTQKIS